jgi:hypothetical protein
VGAPSGSVHEPGHAGSNWERSQDQDWRGKFKIGEASSKLERESLKVEWQVQKWRGKFKIVKGEFKSGEARSKFERQAQNLRGEFRI